MSAFEKFIIAPICLVAFVCVFIIAVAWGAFGLYKLLLLFSSWGLIP